MHFTVDLLTYLLNASNNTSCGFKLMPNINSITQSVTFYRWLTLWRCSCILIGSSPLSSRDLQLEFSIISQSILVTLLSVQGKRSSHLNSCPGLSILRIQASHSHINFFTWNKKRSIWIALLKNESYNSSNYGKVTKNRRNKINETVFVTWWASTFYPLCNK